MLANRGTLTWLSWALVVLVVVSAIVSLLFASGVLLTPFDISDFVDRLVAIRTDQERLFPVIMLGALATLGAYLVTAMIGVVLRTWSRPGTARDAMTVLFVFAGVIGIGSQLMHIGIHDAARPVYCDCGYRAEEVVGLYTALNVAESMFSWLSAGAVTFVGVAVALAGRVVVVSSTWRTVSYAIAAGLLVAVALRIIGALVFIDAFDPFLISDVIIALVTGILVPIWAVMLARGVADPEAEPMPAAT
ncbi:MAG TPA: hypothetical protein VF013_01610 [Candidatus Limnocylindria bacterium]